MNEGASGGRAENTTDEKGSYTFVTEQQKRQLRSTAIFAIDVNSASALVVSSNAANAISAGNDELLSFLRFVVEQIRFDLTEDKFLENFRETCPQYFPQSLTSSVEFEVQTEATKLPSA